MWITDLFSFQSFDMLLRKKNTLGFSQWDFYLCLKSSSLCVAHNVYVFYVLCELLSNISLCLHV